MKHRAGEPWMPSDQYGRSLQGLGVNLLVADVARSIEFQREVLEVDVVYSDPDFAVCAGFGAQWMLHADHTYDRHPMGSAAATGQPRGLGVELRLHGAPPGLHGAVACRRHRPRPARSVHPRPGRVHLGPRRAALKSRAAVPPSPAGRRYSPEKNHTVRIMPSTTW
jgi:catechol 2,3-dioxygenase-like lactoylglutathione lyase family enzyme